MAKIFGLIGVLTASFWAVLALAQTPPNSVEAFNVSQQSGKVIVKLTLKEALKSQPGSFTVANPARIAFDLPNTVNGLGRNSQNIGEGELVSMNIVQAGERTRMVLNLRRSVGYDTQIDGKNLVIILAAAPAASASGGAAVTHFVEAKQADAHTVRDIDFRRGKAGEGRIVVDLSDSSTGIDIRAQGQNLVIDFFKTSLPDKLRRRLDVTDFGTPVQSVNTFSQGENVRMVIAPKGMWEHSAYQTDTQFVVEIKQIVPDPNKLTQGSKAGFSGEKLSLNFQNVEVRSVLNVIADFTDLNIITSDAVGGSLTLRLKDVPWDQALQIILDTRGLDMRKNGNVVWIAPRDELATKEKLTLESQQQIGELEAVRTESFMLNYQKAAEVQALLSSTTQKILSKRGSAVVDARTNTVFVQDVPTRLEEVRKLIAQIDVAVRQVMIEARIVEANDSFSKNLGARLGYNQALPGGDSLGRDVLRTSLGASLANNAQLTTNADGTKQMVSGTPDFMAGGQNVNLPATGLGGFNAGVISAILFNRGFTRFLNLELTALEADGKGKIISSPRVLTGDKVEAVIEQGTELPYQSATSSGATSVSFRKANLSLKVKPQITPDGNIIMTLDINKDSVGQVTAAGFAIDTKHVKTEVLVENGGTVVIGGIFSQDERVTTTKVPLFGDIPVLGNLFKNTGKTDNKTELLVFITPRIIDDRLILR
ncbi:MAG: secretin [Betaproteobacteria bacterium RIFCSPLOWO2_12_FULL_62_13b]|nr:MAG: secretin [Betaproteobacteria bacterium RIFCSPLOWO2_12_FULL_62_13b]